MPNVFLGTTNDDPRKLTKNITWDSEEGIPCKPTDPCDILNPTLILAYANTDIFTKNYAKIPTWGNRHYFIRDIQVLTGGKILLSLGIDFLGTYDSQIRDCPCTITRAQWTGRTMIPDDQFPLNTNNREIRVATFPEIPFNATDGSLIIQTISGEWSKPEPEPTNE